MWRTICIPIALDVRAMRWHWQWQANLAPSKKKCRISLLRTTDMAGPAGLVPPSSGNHPTNLNKTAPPISNLHPCAGVLKRKKLLRSHADAATRRQRDAARPGARHSWSGPRALLRLHGSARLALACLCLPGTPLPLACSSAAAGHVRRRARASQPGAIRLIAAIGRDLLWLWLESEPVGDGAQLALQY